MTMKFISWNVNGLRACIKAGFWDFLKRSDADIVCVQETKATPKDVPLDLPEGYSAFWNSAEKKGYSGTAMFTRVSPLKVSYGLGLPDHDREGRIITAEFPEYYVVNCYTPNSKRELLRLDYRHQQWDVLFLQYLKKLEKKKPVIFCGDLNVAHTEIDLANPKTNKRNAGFTDEERSGFSNLVGAGFVDTFREFEKGGGHYTWWSQRTDARARNIGWRIDYWCISPALRPRLKKSWILPEVKGSDHCPVGMELGEKGKG